LDEVENSSIFKTGRSHPNTPLPAPLAAAPYRASDLVHWHFSDIQTHQPNVCFQGYTGHRADSAEVKRLTQNGHQGRTPATCGAACHVQEMPWIFDPFLQVDGCAENKFE